MFVALQDLRPLYAGRCEYHSSETSPERDVRNTFDVPSVYRNTICFILCVRVRPAIVRGHCWEPESDLKSEDYLFQICVALQVPCQTSSRSSCNLRVKGNTCYCCDLYNCGKWVRRAESVAPYVCCFDCLDLECVPLCHFCGRFFFTLQRWLY